MVVYNDVFGEKQPEVMYSCCISAFVYKKGGAPCFCSIVPMFFKILFLCPMGDVECYPELSSCNRPTLIILGVLYWL